MERTLHGPDREHLTAEECAEWLGIGLTMFKQLVKSGEFPPPLRIGRVKAQRWPWMDPIAFAWLRSRMAAGDAEEPP